MSADGLPGPIGAAAEPQARVNIPEDCPESHGFETEISANVEYIDPGARSSSVQAARPLRRIPPDSVIPSISPADSAGTDRRAAAGGPFAAQAAQAPAEVAGPDIAFRLRTSPFRSPPVEASPLGPQGQTAGLPPNLPPGTDQEKAAQWATELAALDDGALNALAGQVEPTEENRAALLLLEAEWNRRQGGAR